MKNWLYISTFALCIMFTQNTYAQDPSRAPVAPTAAQTAQKPGTPAIAPKAGQPGYNANVNAPRSNLPGQDNRAVRNDKGVAANQANQQPDGCPIDHPCEDQQLNDFWCLMVHYEPRHYQTQKCVEECIPCTKKCWRKVPQCYDVQKCKMVPQYYSETCTKYVNECYEVEDCKTCKKWVCYEEKIPCKKKCWRKVPQCYEVQKCKMVPEYYTETCTKYVNECYEVPDQKTCTKTICEDHCEYCPQYYWKHICGDTNCQKDGCLNNGNAGNACNAGNAGNANNYRR